MVYFQGFAPPAYLSRSGGMAAQNGPCDLYDFAPGWEPAHLPPPTWKGIHRPATAYQRKRAVNGARPVRRGWDSAPHQFTLGLPARSPFTGANSCALSCFLST